MPIFLAFILILLCVTNFYIARRLHKGVLCRAPFAVVFGMLLFFAFVMISGITGIDLPFTDTFSAYWMGIFIYLLVFTLLADVIGLIGKVLKSDAKRYWFIASICILAATLLTVGYGVWNARDIDHVSYEVEVNKTDVSDLKIVAISDVHLGAEGSEARLSEIVSEINSQNPDIVCIAGDFFDTDYNSIKYPEKAIAEIKKISATYGVYMCMGNHDAGSTLEEMLDFTERAGIILLNDEYVVIDNRVVLAGRLDGTPIGGYGDMKRGATSDFLKDYDERLPVIVMDHNPARIGEYSDEVDLVISGHTHKGQIFPASIITNLIYEVDHGYYRKNESSPHVVVTSGVGYWGLPMRVGTNSEILSIKIN